MFVWSWSVVSRCMIKVLMRFTPRKRKDIEITDDERLLHWSCPDRA